MQEQELKRKHTLNAENIAKEEEDALKNAAELVRKLTELPEDTNGEDTKENQLCGEHTGKEEKPPEEHGKDATNTATRTAKEDATKEQLELTGKQEKVQ